MKTDRVIDLSHTLETGMPVYPGTPEAILAREARISKEGYNEIFMQFSTHTGTHLDCGYHILGEGLNTENTPVGRFMGRGVAIDCRDISGNGISHHFLQPFEEKLKKADFVLFNTGWSKYWGTRDYFRDFPTPDPDAARYLTQFGLMGAGIDAISFDPADSQDLPVHRILLSQGMVLIENLVNVDSLPELGFTFYCFPLKIKEGDGSPVRAVAAVTSNQ
ncbi:MAG TPA: cyclase family protein [Bacteroidales bacterium]|nr:cyclase family protein [Bacteroidales bacterium]